MTKREFEQRLDVILGDMESYDATFYEDVVEAARVLRAIVDQFLALTAAWDAQGGYNA